MLTPVLVRQSDWEKQRSPSKQVYSIDMSPISAEQVMPKFSDNVFMELLTRHAPVPQESRIRPIRPITEAFAVKSACVMGRSLSGVT